MRESIKSDLKKLITPAAIGLGITAVFSTEFFGLSEAVQNWEYAKVNCHLDNNIEMIQQGVSYLSRGLVDAAVGYFGLRVGGAIDEFREYLRKK